MNPVMPLHNGSSLTIRSAEVNFLGKRSCIDAHVFLAQDIEGSEYDAMRTFDFSAYQFRTLTIERPPAPLRELLRNNSYEFITPSAQCFGDQLWAHSSIAAQARQQLGVEASDQPADFNECCRKGTHTAYVAGATIDNGCCAAMGDRAECVRKLGGAAPARVRRK